MKKYLGKILISGLIITSFVIIFNDWIGFVVGVALAVALTSTDKSCCK